jgi:hypothetical protein
MVTDCKCRLPVCVYTIGILCPWECIISMNSTVQTINNFLPVEIHQNISDTLVGLHFPYSYLDAVASLTDTEGFAFGHTLFNDGELDSDDYEIVHRKHGRLFNTIGIPLVSRISMSHLLRMKVNCYPRQTQNESEVVVGGMHVDFEFPHWVGIYCVNTCNGFTLLETTGEKLPSVANTLHIFEGSSRHCSVNQSDEKLRLNINIDWIG